MKHKVKVTVIEKNSTRNYNTNIVPIQTPGLALAIMWAMNLSFTGMRSEMIFGMLA